MQTAVLNLQSLYDKLRSQVDLLNDNIEPNFIQMVQNFEDCRRRWQRAELDLGSCKEVLTKAQTERGALEVKLKHARNQVDVEIRRRQKAEADCEKLDRQIQLIRDLLTSEGSSNSIKLSAEQRSALAFLNTNGQPTAVLNTSRRLRTIDESASILSDISYDKTDDSMVSASPPRDWDSSKVRTVRLKKREKRRSSRNHVDGPPGASKRSRSNGRNAEGVRTETAFCTTRLEQAIILRSFPTRGNETLVTMTTVTVPADGGPVEAVSTIETVPYWTRSRRKTANMEWDSESVKSQDVFKQPEVLQERRALPGTPQNLGGVRLHDFVTKTVIKPESCVPCGKRIKFGKISLKCRDCRVVSHPECRERCPLPCIPNLGATPVKIGEGVLADYVPDTSPMIPPLVVHCISEIEQRGLHEAGLYRLSGSDRTVKDLKEKFLRSKTVPVLSRVDDINAVTGLLKDFLRNLKEPLLTFRLNRAFMEVSDDDNSIALIYQTVGDLPPANRDTLAFLVLHLQRVAESLDTRMDVSNLARVFGPTLVGHAVPNPDPMSILQDTKRQPKKRFVSAGCGTPNRDHLIIENANCYATPERSIFGSKTKSAVGFNRPGKFFASPSLK
ncbi:hypothetical protein KUCAC02_036738 [Chaenocephalus aceratus]|nr:hypothetical protein KUCAC02_036738 [Chaenocephalus aceratus]